jgi:hypothetical protein
VCTSEDKSVQKRLGFGLWGESMILGGFSCHLLVLRLFLLLDDLLEVFFDFWSSSCTSCGLGFKIQTLCLCVVNVLINERIEKPSDQCLCLIVMSN